MATPFSTRKNISQLGRWVGETEDDIDDFLDAEPYLGNRTTLQTPESVVVAGDVQSVRGATPEGPELGVTTTMQGHFGDMRVLQTPNIGGRAVE